MVNCCFKRCCLLNPPLKCCYRHFKAIVLETICFILQLIMVAFYIWGLVKFPFGLYKKNQENILTIHHVDIHKPYLKIFIIIDFIVQVLKLLLFLFLIILRISKLINGEINRKVLVLCYIIYYLENVSFFLGTFSMINMITDFAKANGVSKHLINLYKVYPVVLGVFVVHTFCHFACMTPYQVDIQLIRNKTDLSYEEYKKQNPTKDVQIKNDIEESAINNLDNPPQHIASPSNIQALNGMENKDTILPTLNIKEQQTPQNP